MSTTTSVSAAAPVVTGANRARTAILGALLALGALVVAAMVLWQPLGERDAFDYADVAPHRDAGYLGSLLDGVSLGVIGVTLGILVCLAAPVRGAVWATVGAVMTGLGGIFFAAGAVAMGVFVWYVTDTSALPADAGTTLMSYAAETNPGHLFGAQMIGFLLFTLGSLVLMVALWRSRSVPRWLPVAFAVLTVGVFATGGVVLNVVQAVQMLLLAVVAWFLVRGARAAG